MKHLMRTALLSATVLSTALSAAAPSFAGRAFAPPQNVDVAFVLDTTGSMSGLIEGAKQKIWSIANDIAETQKGQQGNIRFALIGYRDRGDAYITKTFDLTDDLSGIYGHLLEFQAQGGGDRPESVNQALKESIDDLHWSSDRRSLRMVFLVGDAPPHMDYQDDTPYAITLRNGRARNIIVNTVQAGRDPNTAKIWHEIADLGEGEYLAIPQNGGMRQVQSPYDEQIEQMQHAMNGTVRSYGSAQKQEMIREKRSVALAAAAPVASDMASYRYKKGKLNQVVTGGNELVEDYEDGKVSLDALKLEELPEEFKGLSKDEQKTRLDALVAQRQDINTRMAALVKKRDEFLKEDAEKRATEAPDDAFDVQVRATIRKQMVERAKEGELP